MKRTTTILLLGTLLLTILTTTASGFVGVVVVDFVERSVPKKDGCLYRRPRSSVSSSARYNGYPDATATYFKSYRQPPLPLDESPLQRRQPLPDISIPSTRNRSRRRRQSDDWEDESQPEEEEDNDYDYSDTWSVPTRRKRRPMTWETDDDYLQEEEEDYYMDSNKEPGNYWSNPADIDDDDDDDDQRDDDNGRRNTKRTSRSASPSSFRSWASPRPPKPLVELYHRLFWYGLEEEEEDKNGASPADRTMFGGTKGKFNGLAYLYDASSNNEEEYNRIPPQYQRKKRPRLRIEQEEDEDLNYVEEQTNDDMATTTSFLPSPIPVTPPYDSPRPMKQEYIGIPKKRQTTTSTAASFARQTKRNGSTSSSSARTRRTNPDWVNNQVNTWFVDINDDEQEEEAYEYEYDYDNDRRSSERRYNGKNRDIPIREQPQRQGRQQRRRSVEAASTQASAWNVPLPDVWGTFFGVDRRELQNQANAYENKIGRIPVQTTTTTRRKTRPTQQPPIGEPNSRRSEEEIQTRYRYVDVQENDTTDEALFTMVDETVLSESQFAKNNVDQDSVIIDAEPIIIENDPKVDSKRNDEKRNGPVNNNKNENTNNKSSWEERALAVERVPPADIPAWGPSGELDGIDARTKALSDALEDIQIAKQKVQERQRTVEISKEAVAIARVDAELERNQQQQQQQLSLLEEAEDDFDQDPYDDYDYSEYSRRRRRRDDVASQNRRRQRQIILDRLRRLDRSADEAARKLRLDEMRLAAAEEELQDIQSRHWALLSFYDPDRAELIVDESFRELEDIEPAVRRYSENKQRKEQEHP